MTASDEDAVRAVRRGDRDAFAVLVERYQSRLFGLVMMIVRQPGGAEEVAQDAFVRACTHLDRFDQHRPFYPWLASIAVRLSQNWLRHHGATLRREGAALESVAEPGKAGGALEELIADQRSRDLWQAVAALSSGERTAVVLYYRDDLTVRDIAFALGVTTGTVKTLLFRARRHLRGRLDATLLYAKEDAV